MHQAQSTHSGGAAPQASESKLAVGIDDAEASYPLFLHTATPDPTSPALVILKGKTYLVSSIARLYLTSFCILHFAFYI